MSRDGRVIYIRYWSPAALSISLEEFEDFHHLNEKESMKIIKNAKLLPRQSDGREEIPFEIRFSNMVLNRTR